MEPKVIHDVAIAGGGPAGLSAAVALARSLRSVVVIDSAHPRNAPATEAHNVLGQEGISPVELIRRGRAEAESYGARILDDRAVAAKRIEDGFELDLASGESVRARRLLLATGLVDELPDVPGVRALWGKSVLHCPFCHGWEVRGRRIAVLGTNERCIHQAQMFRQLSDRITFFVHTMPELSDETRNRFASLGVPVVTGGVRELRSEDDVLRAVVLDDGREFPVDAVVVAPRFVARSDLYEQLGGTPTEHPFGAFISTDHAGRTEIPGVWAAGNASDLSAMVTVAMGAGLMTGAAINGDLVAEDVDAAVGSGSVTGS